MRLLHWWHWAIAGLAIALYVLAGFLWASQADGNLLYNIAAVGTCAAAVLFIAIYTVFGLKGPAAWWKNTVGTCLVLAVGSMIPITGTIAWAVLFHHGLINTPLMGWIEIGGTYLSGLMILALSWMWLGEGNKLRRDRDQDQA